MPYISSDYLDSDGDPKAIAKSIDRMLRENLEQSDGDTMQVGLFPTVVFTAATEAEVLAKAAAWSSSGVLHDTAILGSWFTYKEDGPDSGYHEMAFVLEG